MDAGDSDGLGNPIDLLRRTVDYLKERHSAATRKLDAYQGLLTFLEYSLTDPELPDDRALREYLTVIMGTTSDSARATPDFQVVGSPEVPAGYAWERPYQEIENPALRVLALLDPDEIVGGVTLSEFSALDPTYDPTGKGKLLGLNGFVEARGDKKRAGETVFFPEEAVLGYFRGENDLPTASSSNPKGWDWNVHPDAIEDPTLRQLAMIVGPEIRVVTTAGIQESDQKYFEGNLHAVYARVIPFLEKTGDVKGGHNCLRWRPEYRAFLMGEGSLPEHYAQRSRGTQTRRKKAVSKTDTSALPSETVDELFEEFGKDGFRVRDISTRDEFKDAFPQTIAKRLQRTDAVVETGKDGLVARYGFSPDYVREYRQRQTVIDPTTTAIEPLDEEAFGGRDTIEHILDDCLDILVSSNAPVEAPELFRGLPAYEGLAEDRLKELLNYARKTTLWFEAVGDECSLVHGEHGYLVDFEHPRPVDDETVTQIALYAFDELRDGPLDRDSLVGRLDSADLGLSESRLGLALDVLVERPELSGDDKYLALTEDDQFCIETR